MAELLVRVIDKVHETDSVLNALLLKHGDVVSVRPDGHPWSTREKTSPYRQIVKVPGAKVSDLAHLAREDSDPDPKKSRRRIVSLDPHVFAAIRSERTHGILSGEFSPYIEMTLQEIRAIEIERPRRIGGVVEL